MTNHPHRAKRTYYIIGPVSDVATGVPAVWRNEIMPARPMVSAGHVTRAYIASTVRYDDPVAVIRARNRRDALRLWMETAMAHDPR